MHESKPLLLVEDDENDVELILSVFKREGLQDQVTVLHDGVELMQYLRREGPFTGRRPVMPAAIMLDLKMPRRSGLEVLAELRQDPRFHLLPVIIFTSSREQRDLDACYAHGANAYAVKPLDYTEFTEVVRQIARFWCRFNIPPDWPTTLKDRLAT